MAVPRPSSSGAEAVGGYGEQRTSLGCSAGAVWMEPVKHSGSHAGFCWFRRTSVTGGGVERSFGSSEEKLG